MGLLSTEANIRPKGRGAMLQGRSLIILIFAVIFGIAAVIVANSYLGGVESRKAAEVQNKGMVRIAVANAALEFGQPLTSEKVRFVDWPSWSVPEGAFTYAEPRKR